MQNERNQRIHEMHNTPGKHDTIPLALKDHYFFNRSPPDLVREYDVIGFDADNCMVKYNVLEMNYLMV
jgi:hypothetical protein